MGCCMSQPESEAGTAHEEIQAHMKHEKKIDASTKKLLLLGAGSSGKSTLLKQMKYLFVFNRGYPEDERLKYQEAVYTNVVTVLHTLAYQSRKLEIGTELSNQPYIERLLKVGHNTASILELGDDIHDLLKAIWSDKGIRSTFDRRTEFVLIDNARYFMDSLDRILSSDYKPTFADIVHTRTKTTGIIHEEFVFESNAGDKHRYQICDVGGQRTERQKWVKCFDNVIACIFVIALSGYDQVLFEEETQNRMHEAFDLFEQTTRREVFKNINFIVFLNKKDLFQQKIGKVPFTVCFDESVYTGDPHDGDQVTLFIKEEITKRDVHSVTYFHTTQATDSDDVSRVFAICNDLIIRSQLKKGGLL